MTDPKEPLLGNTEDTTSNTEEISPGIKSTAPGIPCEVNKLATKPGTPRETILDNPTSTIPGTMDLHYTNRNMNIFHQA